MVGPKMQAFHPRIDMLKGNCFILRIQGAPVLQKGPKSYFQSQFSMSKIDRFFSKKIHLRIFINLGDHFLQKTFFSNLNF